MSLDIKTLLDRVASRISTLGLLETVNTHEPKSSPGNGHNCAIWLQEVRPLPTQSGLRKTTGLVVLNARVFGNMLQEPQDYIDVEIGEIAGKIIETLSGDFELGGTVKCVDLLGMSGVSLNARAGYLSIDKTMYRIVDVTVPIIINDIWNQEP